MAMTTPQPFGGSPYQPAGPVPPSGPRARPARARSTIARAAVMLLTVGSGLLTIAAISSETGFTGLITGLVLAAVPTFPVIATFLWLDRYEAEPTHLLAFAFAWGAGVATFAALLINTASVSAITAAGGDPTMGAIVVAPLTEEFFKGLAVLLILLVRRREFDGIVDGIVYAGLAGIGFAFVENILYLGRTLGDGGVATAAVFVLRCVVSPFAHPLFTCATGIGLGIASRTRNVAVALFAPILGFVVAVVLHGAWNLSASSGLNGFLTGYVLLQVPVFVLFGVMAVMARRREGRLIERNLTVYASTGWLSAAEVRMLGSLAERRQARAWARGMGGSLAERAMDEFQDLGSELAFLRERMVRGAGAPDARHHELSMLTTMAGLRQVFAGRRV
ncbi:MAG: PrsW family intramembrane metalloprotease [Kineosporiaceae bacterium]|nr:PrsW family intramembrane metalloprotease [Kineosporiaceae bacterium]MBK7621575.1 PrsW family intramembrane metalloprotease [Kineosporiaceae bacterium]MBK8077262.1 PrsW family intramembrane metalloprotease [Kineosporiaceae bacterium]